MCPYALILGSPAASVGVACAGGPPDRAVEIGAGVALLLATGFGRLYGQNPLALF